MSYITVPAKYSNWVVTPLEEVNINPTETTITFKYDEKSIPVIIDEDGFTEEGRKDLEKLLDETDKWIGVSKPYSSVHTLINDLRNNAVKY